MPEFSAVGLSHPGLVRENNEDSLLVSSVNGVMAVADGMGGAAAGEVASAIFVKEVESVLKKPVKWQAEGMEFVKRILLSANQAIIEHVKLHPEHQGMGCTAELFILCRDGYVLGHVGDSRTYLFRNGVLKQLTRDHTVVQEQLDQGLLTEEQAARHPMRNVILRAVGVNETLSVDIIRAKYSLRDQFLLCSDGLTDMVPDPGIRSVLSSHTSLGKKANMLIKKANEAGGKDNITVAIGQVA